MYIPKSMIINSTYTVYKRGTETPRESRACLPVTGTFTFFFSFFLLQNVLWTAWTYTTHSIPSNITSQISDQESVLSFQLTSANSFTSLQFKKQNTTLQVSAPASKLRSSLRLPASRKRSLTLIVFVRSEQRLLRKFLIQDAASKERYCSFSRDIIAVRGPRNSISHRSVSKLQGQRQTERKDVQKYVDGLS